MSFLPKPSDNGGDFAPPPAGAHPAICYRVIDLGTQAVTFQGDTSFKHQIMLSWELHGEDTTIPDGRPMAVHKRYTWSMHEKATLRRDLEAWRGTKFADKDFGHGGLDIRNVIGKPCMISLVHSEREGKTYANISAILKPPKGMSSGELENGTVYLWLTPELFDRAAYEVLSDSLKATIAKSPEYLALQSGKLHSINGGKAAPAFVDDPLPF